MLLHNTKLKSLINELWDQFWSGGISNPLTAIQQITYLLFMKRLDDLELKRVRDAEFVGEEYQSRFSGTYKDFDSKEERSCEELRWSYFSKLPADEMLKHVRFNVFPFLKDLNGDGTPFTKHMANAVFIIEKPSLLVEAIKKIEAIFTEIEKDAQEGGQSFQDIQGDVYEMLLSEIATAGKNGQFRTPRHIIKLIAEMIQPQLGNRIADPACGTGGFLLGAYHHILSDLVRKKDPSKLITDEDGFERGSLSSILTQDLKETLESSLIGYDIDSSMVRLGLMNLMMHGIDNPQIDYQDTLSKSYNEEANYDVVMANPPFTGSIDKGDINEKLELSTTKTELLFVERIYHMLRNGGTAGIIVPQGVLFGSGRAFTQLREKLVEQCELKAVITMPSGVFKPYAGVSTAVLIFTKGGETRHTFFYEMERDGYELNDKRTPLFNNDGSRDYGDLQDVVKRYHNRDPKNDTERTSKCFMVPKSELEEFDYDLTFNRFKEQTYEEIEQVDPKIIFKELESIENIIQKELKTLKSSVGFDDKN